MDATDDLRARLRAVLDPAPIHVAQPNAILASVLIPILSAAPGPRLVFTERAHTLSRHAGEVSFPGGMVDPGEDLAAAALREAEEELGIPPADVELLGALDPVHTHVTGILIVPFVGMLRTDPRFTPNAAEIEEVIEVPLDELMRVGTEQEFVHEGRTFRTFVFPVERHVIWGATGKILQTFLEVLRSVPADAREMLAPPTS